MLGGLAAAALGASDALATADCAAGIKNRWQAHEQAAWQDLAEGRKHHASADGDLSGFVADVLLCEGL